MAPRASALLLAALPGAALAFRMAAVEADTLATEKSCSEKLVARVNSRYVEAICEALSPEGLDGKRWKLEGPGGIMETVLHDKSVRCSAEEYKSMCGLKQLVSDDPCASSTAGYLSRSPDFTLAEFCHADFKTAKKTVSAAARRSKTCPGKWTLEPQADDEFVVVVKGALCAPLFKAQSPNPCEAKLVKRQGQDIVSYICQALSPEGLKGRRFTIEGPVDQGIIATVYHEKGIRCSAGQYKELCRPKLDDPCADSTARYLTMSPEVSLEDFCKLDPAATKEAAGKAAFYSAEGTCPGKWTPETEDQLVAMVKVALCGPSSKAPPPNPCKEKLVARGGQDLVAAVCQALGPQGVKGRRYTLEGPVGEGIVETVYHEKGVRCSAVQYKELCRPKLDDPCADSTARYLTMSPKVSLEDFCKLDPAAMKQAAGRAAIHSAEGTCPGKWTPETEDEFVKLVKGGLCSA